MDEFRSAMGALPQDGIEASAQALFQALEGSADRREDYWKNRVQPFWQQAWPKSRDLVTPRLAERLTLMSIAARGEFPAALAAVKDWLQPLEHPHYVVDMLHKSGLCRQYPGEALYVLAAVISDQPGVTEALGRCLDEIRKVESRLVQDARYTQLQEYLRIRKSQ